VVNTGGWGSLVLKGSDRVPPPTIADKQSQNRGQTMTGVRAVFVLTSVIV
jgi:hypothetical protein